MLIPTQMRTLPMTPYIILMAVLVIVGIGGSFYVYDRVDRVSRQHIIDRAETISLMVPIADLRSLKGSEEDLINPAYDRLKHLLMDVRGANGDVRFIYLLGTLPSGELYFYADSEPSTSEDYSPPGQVYEEAPESMHRVFTTGVSIADLYSDRWGTWVSGYAPIYSESGRVISMVGMDVPAEKHVANAMLYAAVPILVATLLILVTGLALFVRRRELAYLAHKAEFLSIATHEIRSPLTGVRWALESVLNDSLIQLSDDVRRTLSRAHEDTIKLISRISSFLSVTKLEAGRGANLSKKDVLIREVVDEVISDLALSAKGRGVRLIIDPSVSPVLSLSCDREHIRQVLLNLISNAVKYTRENTEVSLSYRASTMHEILISDHGKGISPLDQAKIFRGYHRALDAVTSQQEGTGLGLYLANEIVRLHGGSIAIQSTLGEGATFIVRLPM